MSDGGKCICIEVKPRFKIFKSVKIHISVCLFDFIDWEFFMLSQLSVLLKYPNTIAIDCTAKDLFEINCYML